MTALEREVEKRYVESGYTPNGFECSSASLKLVILAEMFEEESKVGLSKQRSREYDKLADTYKACLGWN